jgi:hypothetical protein
MNLARLEALFWGAVRSKTPPAELFEAFVGDERLDVVRRMAIYRSAYWTRQQRTLSEVFSRVRDALGAEAFDRLSFEYLEAFPSESPAVEWVGRHFPMFLEHPARAPARALCDLSRLEWARLESLLARDEEHSVSAADLAGADIQNCCVSLRPDLRLLRLSPVALELWEKRTRWSESLDRDDVPRVGCAVWRRRHAVRHAVVEETEFRALESVARGKPFGVVCDVFPEPDAVQCATRAIGSWLSRGWLCNLRRWEADNVVRLTWPKHG